MNQFLQAVIIVSLLLLMKPSLATAAWSMFANVDSENESTYLNFARNKGVLTCRKSI